MKKVIAFLRAALMCISLSACGKTEKYIGKWEAEWTVEKTGNEIKNTIYLYEDGTCIDKTEATLTGNTVLNGTWKVKDSEIKLNFTSLTEGEDIGFDENGHLKDGVKRGKTLKIVNDTTLNDTAHDYRLTY